MHGGKGEENAVQTGIDKLSEGELSGEIGKNPQKAKFARSKVKRV